MGTRAGQGRVPGNSTQDPSTPLGQGGGREGGTPVGEKRCGRGELFSTYRTPNPKEENNITKIPLSLIERAPKQPVADLSAVQTSSDKYIPCISAHRSQTIGASLKCLKFCSLK